MNGSVYLAVFVVAFTSIDFMLFYIWEVKEFESMQKDLDQLD